MNKLLLCLAVAAAPLGFLKAAELPFPAVSLKALSEGAPASAPAVPVSAPSASSRSRQARWVGYVSLEGHDFASTGINWIHLKIFGKMNVADENGAIIMRNVPVAYAGLFQVGDRYVYGYAEIQAPVTRVVDGRVVGQGVLRGAVKMQGFISAGLARIRGNGQVSGVVELAP